MSSIIQLEREISKRLYDEAKASISYNSEIEPLLDNKLILDIYSRNIAIYIHSNNKFENNEFKKVITYVDNEKIEVSVGTIKKNINEPSSIVYGII